MSLMCQLHLYLKFDTLDALFSWEISCVVIFSHSLFAIWKGGGVDFRTSYSVVIWKGRAFAKNGKNIQLFCSLYRPVVEKTLLKKSLTLLKRYFKRQKRVNPEYKPYT